MLNLLWIVYTPDCSSVDSIQRGMSVVRLCYCCYCQMIDRPSVPYRCLLAIPMIIQPRSYEC